MARTKPGLIAALVAALLVGLAGAGDARAAAVKAHEFAGSATRAAEQAQTHAARVRDIVGGVDRPVLRRALRARDAANTAAAAARRADRAAQARAAASDVPAAGKAPSEDELGAALGVATTFGEVESAWMALGPKRHDEQAWKSLHAAALKRVAQARALAEAGIDPAAWTPDAGLHSPLNGIAQNVYGYYGRLFGCATTPHVIAVLDQARSADEQRTLRHRHLIDPALAGNWPLGWGRCSAEVGPGRRTMCNHPTHVRSARVTRYFTAGRHVAGNFLPAPTDEAVQSAHRGADVESHKDSAVTGGRGAGLESVMRYTQLITSRKKMSC